MAETLKEAIAEKEEKQQPVRKIFMVQFMLKVFFNERGNKFIDRLDASQPAWRHWEIMEGDRGLRFVKDRRAIWVPYGQCIIEHRDACPRCGTFINLKGTGHCPSPSCTWPKAELFHCPECKSQLKEGADYCPNKDCRWGWKDPNVDPNEGDETLIPKDTRATITGVCPDCDSQMRNGVCPLGCGRVVEPKPDELLKKGKERKQWPQKTEA